MELFRNVADALEFSADKMKKNGLFATERFFCDVYAFEPGQSQTGHRHAGSDKVYYVLQGTGSFTVDGRAQNLGPGAIVFCPAGVDHAVANLAPERLALLVFMAPPPP